MRVGRGEMGGKFSNNASIFTQWSFITFLTVGYGDFYKTKVIAVLIVFLGCMMTGVMVAVAVTGAGKAFEK
jgi:hypothetical protein